MATISRGTATISRGTATISRGTATNAMAITATADTRTGIVRMVASIPVVMTPAATTAIVDPSGAPDDQRNSDRAQAGP